MVYTAEEREIRAFPTRISVVPPSDHATPTKKVYRATDLGRVALLSSTLPPLHLLPHGDSQFGQSASLQLKNNNNKNSMTGW